MNNEASNESFVGVPGFHVSTSERIMETLERLQAKIKRLEQQVSEEKKLCSSQIQTSSPNDLESSITSIQYMLLVLQLKYVRSVLKKCISSDVETNQHHMEQILTSPSDDIGALEIETQTGESLLQVTEIPETFDIPGQAIDFEADPETMNNLSIHFDNAQATSSRPHYHLKLDDVPFLIGTSTSASHSVIAKVQQIISKMKLHNKALCGPKPKTDLYTAKLNIDPAEDTNIIIKKLSQDLSALSRKQEKLKQQIDDAQNQGIWKTEGANEKDPEQQAKKFPLKFYLNMEKRAKSSGSTMKISFKNHLKAKGKHQEIRPGSAEDNHIYPRTKNQKQESGRHKLMFSLKDFQDHLKEEDLSWN